MPEAYSKDLGKICPQEGSLFYVTNQFPDSDITNIKNIHHSRFPYPAKNILMEKTWPTAGNYALPAVI